ncbi:MAG: 23S rRNA pseudouridine(1911/1915/1917) synthase RluD [Permianibacter sp.]
MNSASEPVRLEAIVPEQAFGSRLDVVLADLFSEYSRVRLQGWVKSGCVKVNGVVVDRAREKLMGGESLLIEAEIPVQSDDAPEDIALDIVYEDEALIVVNKQAGLVVHPAPGHAGGTLVNALLHHAPELKMLPRAGIVHRLDKDTSGLLVVARQPDTHLALVQQLGKRAFLREYDAIVHGTVVAGGTVDAAIGRDPSNRQQMAVVEETGRHAVTHYRVVERFRAHTHIKCRLETGRTHQIRVHMTHAGFPLLGDPVYGGRRRQLAEAGPELAETLKNFRRQALHAAKLGLTHPVSGEQMLWEAPMPADLIQLLDLLRKDRNKNDY